MEPLFDRQLKLYVISGGGFIKIGITGSVTARFKAIASGGVPFPVKLNLVVHGFYLEIKALERKALSALPGRVHGEWFCDTKLSVKEAISFLRRAAPIAVNRPKFYAGTDVRHVLIEEHIKTMAWKGHHCDQDGNVIKNSWKRKPAANELGALGKIIANATA